MSAYVLFQTLEITDPQTFATYRDRVSDTVAAYGGRYVVRGGAVTTLEGDWSFAGPVMIEFPSADAARRWYSSDEYRPLKEMRFSALSAAGVILEGVA
jgi:uncharacterized protein (DUF1330 family)